MANVNVWLSGGQSNATFLALGARACAGGQPENEACHIAHGGNGIAQWTLETGVRGVNWQTDIDHWDACIQAIIDNGDTPVIKSFGWWQGESDNNAVSVLLYEARLNRLIDDLYAHLTTTWGAYMDPNFVWLNYLIGACFDTLDDEQKAGVALIRSIQMKVSNERAYALFADTQWMPRCPDMWHPPERMDLGGCMMVDAFEMQSNQPRC